MGLMPTRTQAQGSPPSEWQATTYCYSNIQANAPEQCFASLSEAKAYLEQTFPKFKGKFRPSTYEPPVVGADGTATQALYFVVDREPWVWAGEPSYTIASSNASTNESWFLCTPIGDEALRGRSDALDCADEAEGVRNWEAHRRLGA